MKDKNLILGKKILFIIYFFTKEVCGVDIRRETFQLLIILY